MYRSGHNENDSKSFGRTNAARGFESHRLRQTVKKPIKSNVTNLTCDIHEAIKQI